MTEVVLERLDRVVARDIAGEFLLVPVRSRVADVHHVFATNAVGAHVWKAIDGTKSRAALVASVCAAFDVGEERAFSEVSAFLDDLRSAGLVREV